MADRKVDLQVRSNLDPVWLAVTIEGSLVFGNRAKCVCTFPVELTLTEGVDKDGKPKVESAHMTMWFLHPQVQLPVRSRELMDKLAALYSSPELAMDIEAVDGDDVALEMFGPYGAGKAAEGAYEPNGEGPILEEAAGGANEASTKKAAARRPP